MSDMKIGFEMRKIRVPIAVRHSSGIAPFNSIVR